MPGPTPKDPALRQRRNRTATAATLAVADADTAPAIEVMRQSLPPRVVETDDGPVEAEWHPLARQLWDDVWASPMAPEYLRADVHGLYVLVALTDAYWRRMEAGQVSGANELAKELRLQRQAFGLSPIDRRRLQWEVEKSEEAAERGRRRRRKVDEGEADARSREQAARDPRALLGVIDGGGEG
jgi:hypothetical protein